MGPNDDQGDNNSIFTFTFTFTAICSDDHGIISSCFRPHILERSEIPEERRWRSGVKERASTTHSVAVIDSDDRGHSSFGEKYDRSINQSQTHRTYVRSSVGVCIRSLFCYSIWIGFRGQITVGWLRFTVHSLASDSLSSLQFHTKVTSPDLVFMNEL